MFVFQAYSTKKGGEAAKQQKVADQNQQPYNPVPGIMETFTYKKLNGSTATVGNKWFHLDAPALSDGTYAKIMANDTTNFQKVVLTRASTPTNYLAIGVALGDTTKNGNNWQEVDPALLQVANGNGQSKYNLLQSGKVTLDGKTVPIKIIGFDAGGEPTDTLVEIRAFYTLASPTAWSYEPYMPKININFEAPAPTGVKDDNAFLPKTTRLEQNYPNPCNPGTTIPFNLKDGGHVKIEVYNIAGQKVATVADEQHMPGKDEVYFNASHLASGIYFYKLIVNDKLADSKKLIVVK